MGERKVCVVSGSSSGIGAATVKRYAREGWDVVVNFSRSREPAEAVAQECRALGVKALVLQGDIADDVQCRELARATQAELGRCDVLVNNAGTTKFVPMKHLDGLQAEDFHQIYAVNVVGTYQLTRAFVPLLEQQAHAGVVNISSVASMMGRGSSIAFMASKGAVNAMTVGLARALSPKIRVNAIAPGLVDTPWLRQGHGDRYPKYVKDWTDRAALEDVIQPEDVADAAWRPGRVRLRCSPPPSRSAPAHA
jgi:NAD(P)-dependent dehydrogenase (short-subunit alcohol dehydrogenase family)